MSHDAWKVFKLADLAARVAGRKEPAYHEFLREPALSCGIYRLPAGARDMQAPHLEDEVYLVIEGRARVRVGGEEREVGQGDVLYVEATAEHSFFDIEEDLTLIAVFGAIAKAF
jgi:mannose-6-phosphate isomerase-like protein (cupin superfamily)